MAWRRSAVSTGSGFDEGRVDGLTGEIRTLAEAPDGTLWGGKLLNGVHRLTFATRPSPGLPRPTGTTTFFRSGTHGLAQGGVFVLGTREGIFFVVSAVSRQATVARFDAAASAFVRDEVLSSLPDHRFRNSFGLVDRPGGGLFANFGYGLAVLARRTDGTWAVDSTRFARLGPHARLRDVRRR